MANFSGDTLNLLRKRYCPSEPKISKLEDRVDEPELLSEMLEREGVAIDIDHNHLGISITLHIFDEAGMDWNWTVEVYEEGKYVQEIEHFTLDKALDLADIYMTRRTPYL